MRFQKSVPLIHKTGLHLRPARRIMDAAGKFKCDIKLMYRGKTANAKSITDIILLAALPGAELLIVTEGATDRGNYQAIVGRAPEEVGTILSLAR